MISDDQIAMLIAERIRDKATDEVPVLSGDLKKSLQTEKIGGGKVAISSVLPYARPVHDGRKALTIRPKKGRRNGRLKFSVGGRTVFAKKVRQPARKANPFLRRAADAVKAENYDFLNKILLKQVSKEVLEGIKKNIKIG